MATPNWKNRTLFHSDNLEILRRMDSETVDLIATDPPFNKNRDFHATPDSLAAGAKFQDRWSWEKDVQQQWVDQLKDDHPHLIATIENARKGHSDGMGAFLCFMAVRLLEMRRVLNATGSLYLQCDPTASHYLRTILDLIFGPKQLRNEIVWCYSRPSAPGQRQLSRVHDILFWYTKGKNWTFHPDAIRQPYAASSRSREGYAAGASKMAGGTSVELNEAVRRRPVRPAGHR